MGQGGSAQRGTLYTIGLSHYCEVGRWALQATGRDFVEVAYMPGFHLSSPVSKIRKNNPQESTGKGASMPLYVAPDGSIIDDSWGLLSLYGEVPADIKTLLNDKVGVAARAIVYSFFLTPEMQPLFKAMGRNCPVSAWQRFAWGPASGKIAEKMRVGLVRSDEYIQSQREGLDAALDEIEKVLPGGPFASGPDGKPSASALALSALLSPLVRPENYSGGLFNRDDVMGPIEKWPQGFQDMVKAYRQRPAGQFVLETYKRRMDFASANDGTRA